MVNTKLFYYKKLVIENIVYIIALFLYLLILAYLGLIYSRQYWQTTQKIRILKREVAFLKNKKSIIDNYRLSKKHELDQFDALLMRLIPNKENFFSVIQSLEKLSRETGFQIIGYKVNFSQPQKESFSITVSGQGDKDKFMTFLKEYNFSGERLITIDKISFSETGSSQYEANLTFYSAPARINIRQGLKPISKKDYQFLKTLKNKLSFELTTPTNSKTNNLNKTYPTNPNPF